jgi:hypothetical protein
MLITTPIVMDSDRSTPGAGGDPRGPDLAVREEAADAAARRMNMQQLKATLWVLEMRLGTPDEQIDDDLMARAVAHQLNNLLTIEIAQRELRLDRPRQGAEG